MAETSAPLRLSKAALFRDLGYTPHPGQLDVHRSSAPRRVVACGVRWGKTVAAAMEGVLVGNRRGALAPGTPESGLVASVTKLIADLRLPGPGDRPTVLRLDPLRSPLDRRREIALQRLDAARIRYAAQQETAGAGGVQTLTTVWFVQWTPTTDATLAAAGLRGVTLRQAAQEKGGSSPKGRRFLEAAGDLLEALGRFQECADLRAALVAGPPTEVQLDLDLVRRRRKLEPG